MILPGAVKKRVDFDRTRYADSEFQYVLAGVNMESLAIQYELHTIVIYCCTKSMKLKIATAFLRKESI